MRVVAVSQRVDVFADRRERRDSLDQNIVHFLLASGFMAVPVPNIFTTESNSNVSRRYLDAFMNRVMPHALFLSGGNDIGEIPERDETEFWMLEYAEQKKLPMLGICRGMQIMAHRAGASLEPIMGHRRTRHKISGEICGNVNSYHNIVLSTCPKDFQVISRSEDGSIEAIRHRNLPWEGWMWHPEREANFENSDVQRLRSLFNY